MVFVIWVSDDYEIYQNDNLDLCGTVFECASRLWYIEITNMIILQSVAEDQ